MVTTSFLEYRFGVQNSAYRFTSPKNIFSIILCVSKDRTETEALIKGLSKAKTREKIESHQS